MPNPKNQNKRREWTVNDEALSFTIDVVVRAQRHGDDSLPSHILTFPPKLADIPTDERIVGSGPVTIYEFFAIGDGSFEYSSSAAVHGEGWLGITAAAAVMLKSMNDNSRVKAAAQADATPMWRPSTDGEIAVSSHGIYIVTNRALYAVPWEQIVKGDCLNQGQIKLYVERSEEERAAWIIHSPVAELALLLWARRQHPTHPYYANNGWWPHGWPEHAAHHGKSPRAWSTHEPSQESRQIELPAEERTS